MLDTQECSLMHVRLHSREDREANALACCVYCLNSTRGYAKTLTMSLIVNNKEK